MNIPEPPESLEEERKEFSRMAAASLARAYGDDEPEYPLSSLIEVNPNYDPNYARHVNDEITEDDTTAYLMSSPANHAHLLRAIERSKDPRNLITVTIEELKSGNFDALRSKRPKSDTNTEI